MDSSSTTSRSSTFHNPIPLATSRKVLLAACIGTVIEWYDFYLFSAIALTISDRFFARGNQVSNVIGILATAAVGFAVRPFGALVFGPVISFHDLSQIGDRVGRKFSFMLTLLIMGVSTTLVGQVYSTLIYGSRCLPTVQDIGPGAGGLLLILRVAQGLALGGEYSGAATFIAEHSPPSQRGYYTSFLQTTATFGLIVCVIILLIVKNAVGETAFDDWGWRLPFLFSLVLVVLSMYIRWSLEETPLFRHLKAHGNVVKNPLLKAFGSIYNLKYMALALFGAVAGQGVVWYTSQFGSLYFMQQILKVPFNDSYLILAVSLLFATPFFILVGHYSDKYGRKPFLLLGFVLALTTYYPIYLAMNKYRFSTVATIEELDVVIRSSDYSPYALCFFVWLQTLYVSLVYGPIAAFLVELFPTSIRYTSMAFPYNIGNGIFGGLVPVVSLSWIRSSGNIFAGLYYTFIVVGVCLVVLIFFVPETYKNLDFETVEEKITEEYGDCDEKSIDL